MMLTLLVLLIVVAAIGLVTASTLLAPKPPHRPPPPAPERWTDYELRPGRDYGDTLTDQPRRVYRPYDRWRE